MFMFGKKSSANKKDAADAHEETSTEGELNDLAAGLAASEVPKDAVQSQPEQQFSDKEPEERREQTVELQSRYSEMRHDTHEIVQEELDKDTPSKPNAQRDYEEQQRAQKKSE
jgi:hypothetical protein